jgi:hypothetical protein
VSTSAAVCSPKGGQSEGPALGQVLLQGGGPLGRGLGHGEPQVAPPAEIYNKSTNPQINKYTNMLMQILVRPPGRPCRPCRAAARRGPTLQCSAVQCSAGSAVQCRTCTTRGISSFRVSGPGPGPPPPCSVRCSAVQCSVQYYVQCSLQCSVQCAVCSVRAA